MCSCHFKQEDEGGKKQGAKVPENGNTTIASLGLLCKTIFGFFWVCFFHSTLLRPPSRARPLQIGPLISTCGCYRLIIATQQENRYAGHSVPKFTNGSIVQDSSLKGPAGWKPVFVLPPPRDKLITCRHLFFRCKTTRRDTTRSDRRWAENTSHEVFVVVCVSMACFIVVVVVYKQKFKVKLKWRVICSLPNMSSRNVNVGKQPPVTSQVSKPHLRAPPPRLVWLRLDFIPK